MAEVAVLVMMALFKVTGVAAQNIVSFPMFQRFHSGASAPPYLIALVPAAQAEVVRLELLGEIQILIQVL